MFLQSKRAIKEFINRKLAFENSESEEKKWELKLNKEDAKVFLKKGGSEFNPDQPYIKVWKIRDINAYCLVYCRIRSMHTS